MGQSQNLIVGAGLNCKTRTGIFGSPIGVGPTGMMANHLQVLQKKFPNDGFTRIIEDKKGNLWFGGDGIHRYDGKTFTHFSTKDGLINPWVWSILEDKSGNLWVGTRETGLFLYDGKTFITYSEYKPEPVTD